MTTTTITVPFKISKNPSYKELLEHIIKHREEIEDAEDRLLVKKTIKTGKHKRYNLDEITKEYNV